MTDRDESARLSGNDLGKLSGEVDSGIDESALACAENRTEQLVSLRTRLAAGEPITEQDVDLAHRRALEAHIRARRAHQAAAEQHRRTAHAHEQAAHAHDESVVQGIGDVEAHRRAAAAHRAARDNEYGAADKAAQLAESELTRCGEA